MNDRIVNIIAGEVSLGVRESKDRRMEVGFKLVGLDPRGHRIAGSYQAKRQGLNTNTNETPPE